MGIGIRYPDMACPAFATLPNGAQMPLLGYGTWQANFCVQAGAEELEAAVDAALRCGYRHIDTAAFYLNEPSIGKVIQEKWIDTGKVRREDLFLVTKLPPTRLRAPAVRPTLQRSLRDLRTDYVDLYLVHAPFGILERGDELLPVGEDGNVLLDMETDHVAVWKAMEEEVDAGRAKAIGISNFNQRQIQRILDNCRIRPANLQVELHVYLQQRPLVEFCQQNGITVTAYSPLGSPGSEKIYNSVGIEVTFPDLISNPVVKEIASALNKTTAQVLLRHIVQRGIAAIPKSTNERRIAQNIQVFDFELSAEDMVKLDALDRGDEGRLIDMKFVVGVENHPEYAW
ncbi:Aldo-keto reductase family 1 member B15 [Frankliniella fusca]|uniref:Aldo-keto reductase family 1 member B15 n=1 Tax=Frankliniella fusca TaxID=407009 RepID=A0AAE1HFA9_9NEOP|nr:Aldo-keto reductase family 1 member B15 [Frankliniella fusca]